MSIQFRWNRPTRQIMNEATGGKQTLLFMANEAKRLMDPYVPALNMVLAQNVRLYTEGDKGIVHYLVPYANYQYKGELMVSRITGSPWAKSGESKVTTGKKLQHNASRHQMATSEWDKAMWTARGNDYTKAVQAYIRGRG